MHLQERHLLYIPYKLHAKAVSFKGLASSRSKVSERTVVVELEPRTKKGGVAAQVGRRCVTNTMHVVDGRGGGYMGG